MALIKVVKVKKIVDALLEYVQVDYNTVTDKTKSFLYKVLGDNVEGDYNFYEQAKGIFLRTDTTPRKIKTSLMFNKDTNGAPHIHVREASRSKGSFNTIGGAIGEINLNEDGTFSEEYRDTKMGAYEVLITSLNPLETILIAEVMYTLMYGAYETFQAEFSTFNFSLKELVFQNNLAAQLYVKSINIDTQQENVIPSVITNEVLDKVNFLVSNINGENITP
jgi:hypothetical protein